jgi:lipopolysaccharide export system permease protein
MVRFQRYIFMQALWPVLVVLAGLAVVALLSQSLAQLDLIVDKRQSALALLWVTLLALPQVVALVLPIALFFAVVYALERLLRESELIVGYATGLSPWQAAAPVLRLAVAAALAHLAITTLLQPLAYREMRTTLHAVALDVAASAVRPGSFIDPIEGLTLYARDERGGVLRDVLIHDARNPEGETRTYTARRAQFAVIETLPGIVLLDGDFQARGGDGKVEFGSFKRHALELPGLTQQQFSTLLKPSDRFLGELFHPDVTYFYDQRNLARFSAEGHFRLSSPLYDLALAAIALAALLGGEYSRHGQRARILIASALALSLRLGALGVQAAAADAPALNWAQYAAPLGVCAVCAYLLRSPRRRPARRSVLAFEEPVQPAMGA